MPVVVPERIDREDIEKYIKRLSEMTTAPDLEKVDRQDYSPKVASNMVNEGYINDEDIWTKIKLAATLVP